MQSTLRSARSRRRPGPGRPRIPSRAETTAARVLRELIAIEKPDREWSFSELLRGLRTRNPGRTEYWYRMVIHRGTADLMALGSLFKPRPGFYSPTATPMALAYRMFTSVEIAQRALERISREPDSSSDRSKQTAATAAQSAFNLFWWWIRRFNRQARRVGIPRVSLRKARQAPRAAEPATRPTRAGRAQHADGPEPLHSTTASRRAGTGA